MSQPPFLIALAGKFTDLGAEYNVRGLGRGDIAPEEVGVVLLLWWGLDDGFETCFFWVMVVMLMRMMIIIL